MMNELINNILKLPRFLKRVIVISIDIFLCFISTWLAFYLRLGEFLNFNIVTLKPIFISISILIPIFTLNGLYKVIFRHSGWIAIKDITRSIFYYGLIYFIIIMFIGLDGTPRTISVIQPILLFFLISLSRLLANIFIGGNYKNLFGVSHIQKGLIYGAGKAGRQLSSTMSNNTKLQIIGFLDDDPLIHNHILNGLRIYPTKDLEILVKKKNVSVVFLAIPSVSRLRRNEIIDFISKFHVAVRKVPDINDIAQGKFINDVHQDLDIDDLLGRDVVLPDKNLLVKNVFNKVILITGAGGSIGSELVKQIIKYKPKKIILIDISEFNLYEINSEIINFIENNNDYSNIELIPLIGSISNLNFLDNVFETWKFDTIYHAAAYKHVPIVEYNVINSIENNVFGTLNLAKLAIKKKVNDFIFISTDKAVRPKNLMGATKRLAEICLQSLYENQKNKFKTSFSMVRFGNVLKSSGSVIPKFRQQIINGGPITLTDPKINRYFMTLGEASQLVIQAGTMSTGGDVFVLDMGEPVLIYELATRMIKLSGLTLKDAKLNPNGDIEIKIIGLRPGEKLYEELLIGNNPENTKHKKIKKACEDFIEWDILESEIKILGTTLNNNDVRSAIQIMQKLVVEFEPSTDLVDFMYNQKKI